MTHTLTLCPEPGATISGEYHPPTRGDRWTPDAGDYVDPDTIRVSGSLRAVHRFCQSLLTDENGELLANEEQEWADLLCEERGGLSKEDAA